MITINELTGAKLKKALHLKKASKGWHNKNKSGGNFGINMVTQDHRFFELTGHHDTQGVIYHLALSANLRPVATFYNSDDYRDATFDNVILMTGNYIEN